MHVWGAKVWIIQYNTRSLGIRELRFHTCGDEFQKKGGGGYLRSYNYFNIGWFN